uniref:EF-hand domain-containing protein n=1 Tax=Panagrolaimus sp. PS1159 TaxID=55785 RepID=A0AC35G003_9BILA
MSEADIKRKAEQLLRTTKDPIDKLRYKCLMRGAAGIKEFARVFRIADKNGNGTLTKEELKRIVDVYQLGISDSDIDNAWGKLDSDGSGTISFDEFLLALRPPMNKNRLALIDKAFKKLDKTGDGFITIEDLKGVYDCKNNPDYNTGHKTKDDIFKLFLRNFEVGGHVDGKVTKEEFHNYYAGISAAIDTDVYFDLMMRQTWKL